MNTPPIRHKPTVFVARQPIVDRAQNLFAYELLFRGGFKIESPADGERATAQMLAEVLLVHGLDAIAGGVAASINFPEEMLLNGSASLLSPPEQFVIEVLEDVPCTPEVLAACEELRSQGFRIALDDVVDVARIEAFAGTADIVKVDLVLTPRWEWPKLARAAKQAGAQLLGEKVESSEAMRWLMTLGYDFFQGYAVGRPIGIALRPLPQPSAQHARLMEFITEPEMAIRRLEDIVSADPGLTFRVLAFAHSAAAAQRSTVSSLRAALILIGDDELRRVARLVLLSALVGEAPDFLIMQSLVRTRMCEELAAGLADRSAVPRHALAGLLSMLDTILGRPMVDVVRRLPITDDIKRALVERSGEIGAVLALVESYEHGDWNEVAHRTRRLGVSVGILPDTYLKALESAGQLLSSRHVDSGAAA